jgi:hypothetical protein
VAEDGSFHVDNVIPNDYRLRIMPAGRGFWIKSARFGGEDVLAGPLRVPADLKGRELEIELGVRTAALDALVVDTNQRPGTGVLVIAVPAAERRHDSSAYRSGTTGGDGRARIEGLAPGEYTLFASDSVEAAAWQDPAVLRRYEARGTVVSIREGETRTITVKITP